MYAIPKERRKFQKYYINIQLVEEFNQYLTKTELIILYICRKKILIFVADTTWPLRNASQRFSIYIECRCWIRGTSRYV